MPVPVGASPTCFPKPHARAGALLGQGDTGAARIVLERAAENGQRAGALHARREHAIRMGDVRNARRSTSSMRYL